MSPILSTILFASAAAAQVTTKIWLPGSPGEDDYQFQASIIGADGDDVTMAIEMSGDDYYGSTETVTYHGTTSFENIITTSDSYGSYKGDLTVSYGCSKRGDTPRCTYSYNGPVAWSSYCEDYTSYTAVITETSTYTYDSPPSTVEQVETYDYRSQIPSFCLSGSVLPDEYAIETLSLEDSEVATYAVTITAGEEKIGATAGASPTNSGASPTKSNSSVKPTSSPSGSNSTSPTGTPTPPAEQSSTGAAAPMKTLAPAIAGLGALVAALL